MYNFVALQKERKNNVTIMVSESEKSPSNPMKHIAKTPGKGQRETAQVLLIILRRHNYIKEAQKPMYKRQNPYIKMYRKRPRFDFSHALQAHNTNNKLIKTIC